MVRKSRKKGKKTKKKEKFLIKPKDCTGGGINNKEDNKMQERWKYEQNRRKPKTRKKNEGEGEDRNGKKKQEEETETKGKTEKKEERKKKGGMKVDGKLREEVGIKQQWTKEGRTINKEDEAEKNEENERMN